MTFLSYLFTRVDLVLYFTTLIALFLYWTTGSKKNRVKMPPGPRPLPFIGNLNLLNFKKVDQSLMELSEKYGEVYTLHLGGKKTVVIAGYKAVKDALVNQADDFGERGDVPIFTLISNKKGIIFNNGESWKAMRRFALSTLRDFGMGKNTLESKIHDELLPLIEYFKSYHGKPFDTKVIMSSAVSNLICSIVFGKRFEYDDPVFISLVEKIAEDNQLFGSPLVMFFNFYPFIGGLLGAPKKVMQNIRWIRGLISKRIKNHRDEYDINNISGYIDAFLTKMEQESSKTETYFDEENLASSVLDLLEAGTDTTATTLCWGLILMAKYPEIQKKVQEEIQTHIKPGQLPSVKVRRNMPYTDAVVHEMSRFGNIIPLGLTHRPPTDIYFRGYCIPKGTDVIALLASVLYDKTQWKTPDEFNPNHFLDDSGKFVLRDAFMPFSAGRRACAGESLAKMEIFLFFTGLVQAFTFYPEPGVSREDLDIKPDFGYVSGGHLSSAIFCGPGHRPVNRIAYRDQGLDRGSGKWYKLSEKYGEVYTVQLGSKPMVVISGYKAVKDALVNQAFDFGDRASTPASSLLNNQRDDQCELLKLGLNYCPSKHMDVFETVKDLHLFSRKVLSLKEVETNHQIIVKPADKRGNIVVMSVEQYEAMFMHILNNRDWYTRASTSRLARDAQEYHNLIRQVHKSVVSPPGRPIISGMGALIENASRYVDQHLQPLVMSLPSYVRDTGHIIRVLDDIWVSPEAFLVTLDVEALYISIPHNMGLRAVESFLNGLCLEKHDHNLFLLRLLNFVLAHNLFLFKNQLYHQIQGTKITFLDITINKDTTGHITTTLYRKETAANTTLRASSSHPSHLLKSIPYGEYLRARRNCSTIESFQEEARIIRNRLTGVLFSNGEAWKVMRRFTLATLRDFGMGKKTIEDKIQDEIIPLIEYFKAYHGRPFDTNIIMNGAVSNVICSILFGKRFEYDDQIFKNLLRIIGENNKLFGSPMVAFYNFYPRIGALLGAHKKLSRNIRCLAEFIINRIEQHKQEYDANNISGFIDAYIMKQKQESSKDGSYFDDQNLVATVMDLFDAGTDTTATTLRWGILLMAKYPEIQKKVQVEIQAHSKPGQFLSVNDRKSMPYTDAVIHELQRFANIVPLNGTHKTSNDVHFRGYFIKKDTDVTPLLTSVLYDKTQWKTPNQFNPNHFLDADGKFVLPDAFMPFSAGKRACAGEALAKMELFLFFTGLVKTFTFYPAPGVSKEELDIKPATGFILTPRPHMICARLNY
ncbi:uncharacterized protein PAF06_014064 [Gastrophryne carolinensis]